jgi:hypothetical protein
MAKEKQLKHKTAQEWVEYMRSGESKKTNAYKPDKGKKWFKNE